MNEEKYAFKMKLNPDMVEEYQCRHAEIWPELSDALRKAGVRDYSIHLDQETNILFAVMWRRSDHSLDALAQTEIMQKWWDHMADIMQTHPDNQPMITVLKTVFHLT